MKEAPIEKYWKNKIQFASYLRDSLVQVDEAISFDRYQTECNLFLSVRIPPGRLLLLIGHELD
ncbi:hypothetical protein RGQ29_004389 [Quercus rubra]|uniref:Uncharacterized protein n=1 Tax=Quercus rubra TaxID=3512 RepID=A0AAN7IFP8_QUERU|nr:hypothetical protein RGQ29_004389 [Quercus rubra]